MVCSCVNSDFQHCNEVTLPIPHFGLLPGLAAHFCFLLRHGVRYMAHALSLLWWQLYACKTQHAFVLSHSQLSNFNIWKFTI